MKQWGHICQKNGQNAWENEYNFTV